MRCTCEKAEQDGVRQGLEMAAKLLEKEIEAAHAEFEAAQWGKVPPKEVSVHTLMREMDRMIRELVEDIRGLKP
jgi:hypothetical protein